LVDLLSIPLFCCLDFAEVGLKGLILGFSLFSNSPFNKEACFLAISLSCCLNRFLDFALLKPVTFQDQLKSQHNKHRSCTFLPIKMISPIQNHEIMFTKNQILHIYVQVEQYFANHF